MKLEPLCFSLPISSYIASQSLKTCKNNYLMRWVNVWLFLSAPSIKQPLCNSFYSLRTSSGGVTSTLVLHPLDLIKIRFQGKILGITWFCVTCKCLSNRKSFPCLHSLSVYIRLCKHRKKVFYCFYKITLPRKNANSLLRSWLKEKFLPVAKSYTRSLARVMSSCFAKRCFPKYGFFSLEISA